MAVNELDDAALDALSDLSNGGDFDSQRMLAFLVVDLHRSARGFEYRRVYKKYLMRLPPKALMDFGDQTPSQVRTAAMECLFNKDFPHTQIAIDRVHYARIIHTILDVYGNTFSDPRDADKTKVQTRFRNELRRSLESIGVDADLWRVLRAEGSLAYGKLYAKMAIAWFEATVESPTAQENLIFRLLHQPIATPGQSFGVVSSLPPLNSIAQFQDLVYTYNYYYKRDPLDELSCLVHAGLPASELGSFLGRIRSILGWYTMDYLPLARQLDRGKKSLLNRCFVDPNSVCDTEIIPPVVDRRKGRRSQFDASEYKHKGHDLMRAIYRLLTEKEREAFLFSMDGRSDEEIARECGVSRASVRDRLKGAHKKLKSSQK